MQSVFTARCTVVQSAVLRSHVVCLSVCPSVCPSVTLVNCDHIGWNSSIIVSPLVSLRRSLFAALTWRVCSKGNTPKFGPKVTHPAVDLSVGDIRSQIAAEWLHIAQRSQWRAYRKPPSLFLMVPLLTLYDLPFPPKWGFHMPPTYANGHISATGDPIHFMFGSRVGFSGKAGSNGAIYCSNKSKMATAAILEKFQMAISPQQFVWFSGTADLMALFSIRTNSRWRPLLSWIILNGHISAMAHDLLI